MKPSFSLLWRWMFALTVGSVLLGFLLILLPGTSLFRAYDQGMLQPFWPAGAPRAAIQQYRFLLGITGAAIVGWGVTLIFIVAGPFRRQEPWAWWAMALGISAWIGTEAAVCITWKVSTELWLLGFASVGLGLPLLLSKPWFSSRDHS